MNTKISYRGLLSLVCLLFSCQLMAPVSQPSATPQPSPSLSEEPVSENVKPEPVASAQPFDVFQAMQAFYLARPHRFSNCRYADVAVPKDVEVRKSFVPTQSLGAGEEAHQIKVVLDQGADLKRRMLLNLRHGEIHVDKVDVSVNGVPLETFFPDGAALVQDAPDMVWDLCAYLDAGENEVNIMVDGPSGSSIDVFLDGFIMPIDIPQALHSVGETDVSMADKSSADEVFIKFTEEMRVRHTQNEEASEQLVDISGVSLYPLRLILNYFSAKVVVSHGEQTPEEADAEEKRFEEEGDEVPNSNLSRKLILPEQEDPDAQVELLGEFTTLVLKLPFIESIYFRYIVFEP